MKTKPVVDPPSKAHSVVKPTFKVNAAAAAAFSAAASSAAAAVAAAAVAAATAASSTSPSFKRNTPPLSYGDGRLKQSNIRDFFRVHRADVSAADATMEDKPPSIVEASSSSAGSQETLTREKNSLVAGGDDCVINMEEDLVDDVRISGMEKTSDESTGERTAANQGRDDGMIEAIPRRESSSISPNASADTASTSAVPANMGAELDGGPLLADPASERAHGSNDDDVVIDDTLRESPIDAMIDSDVR